MRSSQFTVAVHALAYLGWAAEAWSSELVTSEDLAASVNTHPVVVRRLLGSLREAGLVTSQPGPGGGWRLVRAPDAITLRDVYEAVADDALFAPPHRAPSHVCPIGRTVHRVIGRFCTEAERAMAERLGQFTIADTIDDVAEALDAHGMKGQCPPRLVSRRAGRKEIVTLA